MTESEKKTVQLDRPKIMQFNEFENEVHVRILD